MSRKAREGLYVLCFTLVVVMVLTMLSCMHSTADRPLKFYFVGKFFLIRKFSFTVRNLVLKIPTLREFSGKIEILSMQP